MAEPPRPKRYPLPEASWPSAEEAAESRLFQEGRLGSLSTRTRSWVPAMVPWRATEEGEVTDEVLEWYARFAHGRPGVLVVEATGIRDVPSGPLLRIGHDRFIPGLEELCRVVHRASRGQTRLLIQLIDFLAVRRRPDKAKFLERFLVVDGQLRDSLAEFDGDPGWSNRDEGALRQRLIDLPHDSLLEVLSPRDRESLEYGYRERVTDTHLEHIAELPTVLPNLFAEASGRARDAGFDGVELHYAHAYTMSSFLSATNTRSDGYGGDIEGRARLPLEVFRAVRATVGDDYCVGCRFLGDEVIPGGSRLADAVEFAERFAREGFDFLSVSKGGKFDDAKQPRVGAAVYPYTGESGHECMPTVHIGAPGPFGRNLPLSAAIRARVRELGFTTPVVGAGGIGTFDLAESALARGDCDFVGAARQSLADPDWWAKIEQGAGAQVRRCIFTNYCEGLDQKHRQVTCQLWDRDLEEPDAFESEGGTSPRPPIRMSHDGKRRLTAPPWSPNSE